MSSLNEHCETYFSVILLWIEDNISFLRGNRVRSSLLQDLHSPSLAWLGQHTSDAKTFLSHYHSCFVCSCNERILPIIASVILTSAIVFSQHMNLILILRNIHEVLQIVQSCGPLNLYTALLYNRWVSQVSQESCAFISRSDSNEHPIRVLRNFLRHLLFECR